MKYSISQYAEALESVLEKHPRESAVRAETLARFMGILRRTNDAKKLPEILVKYEKLHLRRMGKIKVEIESAAPLPASLKREIEGALGKPLELIETVNPKVLAGLSLLLNDTTLIDATALRRLETLRK